jgi:hypothetical protein
MSPLKRMSMRMARVERMDKNELSPASGRSSESKASVQTKNNSLQKGHSIDENSDDSDVTLETKQALSKNMITNSNMGNKSLDQNGMMHRRIKSTQVIRMETA